MTGKGKGKASGSSSTTLNDPNTTATTSSSTSSLIPSDDSASKSRSKSKPRAAASRSNFLPTTTTSSSSEHSSSVSLSLTIPPPYPLPLPQLALNSFFYTFTFPSKTNNNSSDNSGNHSGFLSFLQPLYAASAPDSPLCHATKALAYINFTSTHNTLTPLMSKAHAHYRSTLLGVSQSLPLSANETTQDSLIVAVLLLVMFESLTREMPAIMMSHARGLQMLLMHRGEAQLRDETGWAIFRHVYGHMQIYNMELLLHPGPEAEAWLRDVNKSDPSAQAIWDKYRISRARACAADALALPPESLDVENKLLAALHEVQELDVELSIWAHHLPASYQPEIWRLDSDGNATIVGELPNTIPDNWINRREDIEAELEEPSTQYIMNYGDMWYTSFWHNHRTSRLMLNETLIRLANRLNLPAIRLSAIATIQQMLAETCASFQHSLGDVVSRTDQSGHAFLDVNANFQVRRGGGAAAYLAVWSLRHVVSSDFAREDQIQMASAALQRISGQFGVRQALKLANRGFQCPALSAREG